MKDTVAIRVEVSKDVHKAARIEALQQDVSLAKVVIAALKAYLAKRGKVQDGARR